MSGTPIDVSNYKSWKQITTPSGGIYYQVPGSSWVFDPVTTKSTGRNQFFKNPQPALDAAQEAKDAADAQQRQIVNASSPLHQTLPVVGAVAGTVGGAYGIHALTASSTAQTVINTPAGPAVLMQDGTITGPGAASVSGATAATPTAAAFNAGATSPNVAGPTQLPEVTSTATALDPTPGAVEAAPTDFGGVLPALGVAAEGVHIGQNALSAFKAGTGQGALGGAVAGFKGSGGLDMLNNLDPFALQARLAGGFLGGVFGHESTSQAQAKRWGELADQGITGAAEQKQALDSMGDKAGTDLVTGGKWNFDTALNRVKAGSADEFRGVYGNFKTFGNDWSTYTPDQQRAIVSGVANAGLYDSHKGDVTITDEDAARKIKDQVLGVTTPPPAPQAQPAAKVTPQAAVYHQLGQQLAARVNARGR